MVNTGKPSAGCYTCRARRIKCDEGKPECFRCQKSKRVCTGYRAPQTRLKPERKAKKEERLAHQGKLSDGQSFAVQLFGYNAAPLPYRLYDNEESSMVPTYRIVTPLEDQAMCYFLKNFMLTPSKGNSRTYMGFVTPLLNEEAKMRGRSTLNTALKAVSLALLGNRPHSKPIRPRAVKEYSKALQEVNFALQNPELALEDNTLASVILLGMFEIITCSTSQTSGWISHAEGAAMMVKARDKKKGLSDLGRIMHVMVRAQLSINCFVSSSNFMLDIGWWMKFGTKDGLPAIPAKLNLEAGGVHAQTLSILDIASPSTTEIERILALLNKAKALEDSYRAWEANLPDMWRYKVVAYIDQETMGMENLKIAPAYPGRVDTYKDTSAAMTLNMMRAARLMLLGDIVRISAWLCHPFQDYRTTSEYLSASRTSKEVIEDVIASVPYFLGQIPVYDDDGASSTSCSSDSGYGGGGEGIFGTSVLGLFISWPLFVIQMSDFTTDEQRVWASGRLRYIGQERGLAQSYMFSSLNIRLPSMFIYRDQVALVDGKFIAKEKCMELAMASCKKSEYFGEALVHTIEGLLGFNVSGRVVDV